MAAAVRGARSMGSLNPLLSEAGFSTHFGRCARHRARHPSQSSSERGGFFNYCWHGVVAYGGAVSILF